MKIQTSRRFLARLADRGASRLFRAAALFTLGAISTAHAAVLYWDGGTQTVDGASQGGTGTWNTATFNWDNGAAEIAWPGAGYSAVFGGTAGTVTLGTAITADAMAFNVGGYTLNTGANTLTLAGLNGTSTSSLVYAAAGTTISGTISIAGTTTANTEYFTAASGATLGLSGNITQGNLAVSGLTMAGPGVINYSGSGTLTPGKFNVQGGATLNSSANITISSYGNYTGVADTTLSTWNVTAGTVAASTTLFLGNGTGTSGAFKISGGTATFAGTINVGDGFSNSGDGTGTLTVSGGTLSTGTGAGNIRLGNARGGVGTFNLDGGTFSTNSPITLGSSTTGTGTGGSGTFNFNGGTLQALGTSISMSGLTTANVRNGGAVIDTNGNGFTIAQSLLHSTVSGDNATDGGLTKSGSGTLTLTGVNTYTGGTAISAGTLAFGNTAAQTLVGVVSGAGTLNQIGSGTTNLTAANTYTGATLVGGANAATIGGVLQVSGAAGAITSSSGIAINGAGTVAGNPVSQFLVDNGSITTATAAVNRVGDSIPVTFNYGGDLRVVGSGTTGVALSETIGAVTLGTGSGSVSISVGASSGSMTLTAASFSRGSNFATGLIRGTNLGQSTASAEARFTLIDASGLTLIGTTSNTSGSDTGTTTNLKIVPFLLGASSASTSNNAYLGASFLTYDSTNGFRRLGNGEYATTATATTDSNVAVTSASASITGAKTFNSLLLLSATGATAGTVATPGTAAAAVSGDGSSLTISSGALANVATGTAALGGFSSIIFGNGSSNTATTANEAVITNVNQNSAALTISSPINTYAAGGGLTKAGAGPLILTAANLYTGVTTINAGTLQIGNGTTGSLAANSGAVTITPGATLSLVQPTGSTFANNIVDNGTLSITNAGTETLSGNISGTTGIAQATASTALTLAGTNTYTGATTVTNGTLNLTGSITGSNVTVTTPGVFTETSTGVIGGTGITFTLTSGTATLAGQNTYTGSTTFTAGTLNIAGDGTAAAGPLGTGTLTLAANAETIQATGGAHTVANNIYNAAGATTPPVVGGSNNLTFTGVYSTGTTNSTLTINNTGLTTFAGGINIRADSVAIGRTAIFNGSGNILVSGVINDGIAGVTQSNLTYAGTGTLTLTGANTYTGTTGTTITSGTVQLGNGGTKGSLQNINIVDNSNFVLNRSNAVAQTTSFGTISGTGTVTLAGTGTTTFNKANTYTGTTTINRGTLDLGGSTAVGSIGTIASGVAPGGALVLGGGTLNFTRTGTLTQSFSGTTVNTGASTINNAVSTDTLALNAITRNVGGTAAFTATGPVTTSNANLNNTSSASGTTGILGGYATDGAGDWATVSSGKIVQYTGYSECNNVTGFSNVSGKDVTDGVGTGGPGYDGTYTNSVTLNSLRFNEGNANSTVNINPGNNLTITSGGILVTPNVGVKDAFINGGGLTTTGTDIVVQQNNIGGGHLQIGSSIYGTGVGLTKSGVGQLDLNGVDASYTGVTTVNGGTLQLMAATTGTSNVTVNNTGTLLLGANDRINHAATVTLNAGTINAGGFKAGNATGTATAVPGLGALTLSYSSTLDFGAGHGGSSVLAFANSAAAVWNGTLTLVDFTPGTDFLSFGTDATGLTAAQWSEISLSGFTATGLDSFGDVIFSGTAVPEPSTWAAGFLMLGVLGYSQRRQARGWLSLARRTRLV